MTDRVVVAGGIVTGVLVGALCCLGVYLTRQKELTTGRITPHTMVWPGFAYSEARAFDRVAFVGDSADRIVFGSEPHDAKIPPALDRDQAIFFTSPVLPWINDPVASEPGTAALVFAVQPTFRTPTPEEQKQAEAFCAAHGCTVVVSPGPLSSHSPIPAPILKLEDLPNHPSQSGMWFEEVTCCGSWSWCDSSGRIVYDWAPPWRREKAQ